MFFKSTGLSGGWRRQRSIYALKELQTQLTFFIPIPDCLAMTGENIMWSRWKVRWARWKYQVDHVNLSATCYDRLGLEDLVLASWTHSLLSHFFSFRFSRFSRISSWASERASDLRDLSARTDLKADLILTARGDFELTQQCTGMTKYK